jgi:methyl-accepting chemotaxis protein
MTIEQSIASILDTSGTIASATNEQNTVAQEISANTGKIKQFSAASAESTKTTSEASERLDELGKELLKGINYFKL